MKKIILIIAIVLAAYTSAWAFGDYCKLDLGAATAANCNREYASGVKICREMHPNPLDYSDLAMCIGNSRDVYNKCTAGCM